MYHASSPHSGPPPICFNCSKEGHFVVDCPEPRRTSIGVAQPNFSNGSFPGNQTPQRSNSWNPGATVTQFSKPPPVVTRYAVPNQPPQYGNSPGAYGPSPTAPPYHAGSAPPSQSYPPPAQGSYPPQQYGAAAPPYSQNPSPQSYSAPTPHTQYGQGYQVSPNGQYSPLNGTPQYNGAPQQYGSPTPTQYQSPVNQYPRRNYSVPPPPQWNKTTPDSASSPFGTPSQQQPPNQLRRDSSIQREFSGTPSQQLQSQQTPQTEQSQVSESYQQTPQTPASGHTLNGAAQVLQNSPADESYFPPKSVTESVASSRASTPYGRYGSVSSAPGKQKASSVTAGSRPATPDVHVSETISLIEEAKDKEATLIKASDEVAKKEAEEEGEYTEEDLAQELFNWEYKKIFKEPQPTESVALSQPLSYTYNVTPVPLLDQRSTASVSRYARKDNLKEYLRPIRSQSQWDYLKEDPAFSDTDLDGPLIPLREARSWMEKRHGIEVVAQTTEEVTEETIAEAPEVTSEAASLRKRAWTDEQEDVDNQIQLEASMEQNEPSSKRQKNEQPVSDDRMALDTKETTAPGTPVLGRPGTPTFGNVEDDAWAPEPGEAASAPMDPTEALLASLGVSGAPKPVREQSDQPSEDLNMTSFGSMPHSMSPQAQPSDNSNSNISPQEGPAHMNGYGHPQYNAPQQGSPPNGNASVPPQSIVPYNTHGLPVYNNAIPPQPTLTPPYGPPQSQAAPYGQRPPQRPPSYSNNQYGPPQGQYSKQYDPPQPQYPPQGQYGPPQPQFGPPQNQYPPQGQYGPPQSQYAPPQPQYDGQPQYNGPAQNQYGPPQGAYGSPQAQYNGQLQGQYGPPQGQWGPPQAQYNNGYPPHQGPGPQYGNPVYGPPQGPPVQDDVGYGNGMQQGNPQPFNNQSQGAPPPRQDSGYVSARGSYSNGSAPNGFINGGPPQQGQQQMNEIEAAAKAPVDGENESASPTELVSKKKASDAILDHESPKAGEPLESPLSPTAAEILGKLTQPSKPRKIIRVISGKNKDASRQPEGDSLAKKAKRPAPVVAEAYSRRW